VEYVCAHVSMETLVTHTWRARTHVCCPLQCRNTVNPFPAPDVYYDVPAPRQTSKFQGV